MKTFRVWDQIVAPAALWAAWRRFERGKRRRLSVAAFSVDADRRIHRIARSLAEGAWRPSPYQPLFITDPKRRLISRAPVGDRVVHQAIHAAISPLLDRRFIEHSYACLPGRGTHRAMMVYQRRLQRFRHVLQLDVRRYFYSIQHETLRGLLHRALPESNTRQLLDRILASGRGLYARPEIAAWLGWEEPGPANCGLPIGNLTSQWWGTLYLDGLDHHAQRVLRVPAGQRYMDDLTLFGDDPAALVAWRDQIGCWLAEHRGLALKDPLSEPSSTREATIYLGYRITREDCLPGPKARGRIPAHLRAARTPGALQASVTAIAGMWMVGGRRGVSGEDPRVLARLARLEAGRRVPADEG